MSPRCCFFVLALSWSLPAQDGCAATWTVRGRAVDGEGKPVGGACLLAGREDEVTTAAALTAPTARSDAEGRFEVGMTVQEDVSVRWIVLLAAPGRLSAWLPGNAMNLLSADHVVDCGDVALPAGVTLRGVVRQRGGGALAGARVNAKDALQALVAEESMARGACYSARAVTDDKGQFTLPGVAATGARLLVQADGFFEQELPFVGPGDAVVVELQASGFVEGEVQDCSGKPADAWVYLQSGNGSGMQAVRTTAGKFRIGLSHPGGYTVSAALAGSHVAELSSDPCEGPRTGLVLRPKEPASGRGTVVLRTTDAATGKAVEDVAALALWGAERAYQEERLRYEFERNAVRGRQPGELRLPGPAEGEPDLGVVMVEAKSYATLVIPDVRWSDEAPVVVEAKLAREAVVTGVVVDEATGKPAARAVLALGERSEISPPWWPDLSAADQEPGARVTDDAGRFRVARLPAGKTRIRAELWPGPASAPVDCELQAGEVREGIRLVIQKGISISGRLVGGEPGPSSVLELRLRPAEYPHWGSFDFGGRQTPIGNGGSFVFHGLSRGDYELYLELPHRQGRGGWLEFPLEPLRVRRIDLQRDCDASECLAGRIHGKVTVTGTAPPPGRLVVAAYAVREGEQSYRSGQQPSLCEPVAADGTFALPAVPGMHRLELLDLGTRVPVAMKAGVRVDEGRTAEVEWQVDCVCVKVALVPEQPDARMAAKELEVFVHHEGQEPDREPRSASIPLTDGRTEVELFLPRLSTRLVVHRSRFAMQGRNFTGQESVLAEREIEPEAGKTDRVEIVVPAAPKNEGH